MGTDIHFYVERLADGHWHCLTPPRRDDHLDRYPRTPMLDRDGQPSDYVSPFWGPFGCLYEGPCSQCVQLTPNWLAQDAGPGCRACLQTGRSLHWYSNRNYDVFAILADVRNGHGFAGCPTGSGFEVIADPRGVPDDASDVVAEWNTWDHTPSWLFLAEVLEFDWDQRTEHYGVIPLRGTSAAFGLVDGDDYEAWRIVGGGRPRAYSGNVFGNGIRTVTPAEADALLLADSPDAASVYVRVAWSESYRESADDFLAFVEEFVLPLVPPEAWGAAGMPATGERFKVAQQAVRDHGPFGWDGIRFVFGFDS